MLRSEKNFKDPQFKTSMIPGPLMKFARQCIIFQLIGMAMFGIRSIIVIAANIRNTREVPAKR